MGESQKPGRVCLATVPRPVATKGVVIYSFKRLDEHNKLNRGIAVLASVTYSVMLAGFTGTLIASLVSHRLHDTHAADVLIPLDATCLRASRHADYASAWLPVG